jgi:signal transduction histidine kinase
VRLRWGVHARDAVAIRAALLPVATLGLFATRSWPVAATWTVLLWLGSTGAALMAAAAGGRVGAGSGTGPGVVSGVAADGATASAATAVVGVEATLVLLAAVWPLGQLPGPAAAPVLALGIGSIVSIGLLAGRRTALACAIGIGIGGGGAFALAATRSVQDRWSTTGPALTSAIVFAGVAATVLLAVPLTERYRLALRRAERRPRGADGDADYAEATRLLTRLRAVARRMPGTLDPGGIADKLLEEVRRVAPADRAAVFSSGGGGRLTLLAQAAPDRPDWETSLEVDTPLAEAWASQQPITSPRLLTRTRTAGRTSALVLPLITGVRTVGLVALEADRAQAFSAAMQGAAAELVTGSAVPLETALLFDEVRSLATAEERQRLAREIHDGVAQELVIVGYGVDDALAQLPDGAEEAAAALRALRGEVTRIITELRLSLFELRTDVERHGGLGTAIADHARTIGASAGLRVHLSLDESTTRLPAALEGELLRIAQEAVNNVRKHARAENLWVTCETDPPYARIEIADDGRGMDKTRRSDSYGLSIMAERAHRIRGALAVDSRHPRGTTVSVTLGARSGTGGGSREQMEDDDAHPEYGGRDSVRRTTPHGDNDRLRSGHGLDERTDSRPR